MEANPLGGAVRLYDASGNQIENFWLDPEGNFKTWPLANGTYFVVTVFTHEVLDEACDNFPCESLICNIPGTTPIVVAGGDVTGVEFVLGPILVGGHISGELTDGSETPLHSRAGPQEQQWRAPL